MSDQKWEEINLLAIKMSRLKDENKNYRTIKMKIIQKVFELASSYNGGSIHLDEEKPIKHSKCNWDIFVDFIMKADNYDHKKNATFKTYFYRYLDFLNKDRLKKVTEEFSLEDLDLVNKIQDSKNDFEFIFDEEDVKLPLLVQQARLIRPLEDYIKTKDKERKNTFFTLIFTNDCIGVIKHLYIIDNKNEYYELKLFEDEIFISLYKNYLHEVIKDNPYVIDKIASNDFYEYVTVSKSKHEVEGVFLDDSNMAWHLVKIDKHINLYEKDNLINELKKEFNSKRATISYHRNKLRKLFLELLKN